MGRGETITAQIAEARQRRNRAMAGIASSITLGAMSMLWLFSLDYTTGWFKLAGVLTALLGAAFFSWLWIYIGAQLDLEARLEKLSERRR